MPMGLRMLGSSIIHSFCQLWKAPVWAWLGAIAAGFCSWAFPDEAQRVAARAVFVAVGVDTVTGLWVAYKGKSISSEGFAKLFTKLLVYFGCIVLLANALDVLPMETTVERSLMTGLLSFMVGRESLSFIENCKLLGYDAPPFLKKLFERMQDKDPTAR